MTFPPALAIAMFHCLSRRSFALLAALAVAVPVSLAGDDVTVPFSVSGTTTVTVDAKADAKISPADVSKKPESSDTSAEPVDAGDTSAPAKKASEPVAIDGPKQVEPYRLVRLTLVNLPDGGSAVWEVFPFGAVDGEELNGGRTFVFVGPPAVYNLSVTYLSGGMLGKARHSVTIGKPKPPEPDPIDPDIPPGPDLKGFAKQVYDASAGLAKATVTQAAGAYGSQVSAINAGAYNALAIDKAKEAIANAIAEANPPRQSAVALFDLIDGELQRREEAGQLASLADVSAALAEITAGLEARAR